MRCSGLVLRELIGAELAAHAGGAFRFGIAVPIGDAVARGSATCVQ